MIDYYEICSPLSADADNQTTPFFELLSRELGEELRRVELADDLHDAFALLYVASGGSERYFPALYARLKDRCCYILASGEAYSLAASMEILSYLKKHGGTGQILHGDAALVAAEIRALRNAHRAMQTLRGKNSAASAGPLIG